MPSEPGSEMGLPPAFAADPEVKAAFVRKLNAEAARAEAEAKACDRESDANTWRLKGEADRLNAERQQLDAERKKLDIDIVDSQIVSRVHVREEQERLAENKYHHLYHFTSEVSGSTVRDAMKMIDQWRRIAAMDSIKPEAVPIDIIFTSPGGSVFDGLVFFDYLQEMRRAGHPVSTGTYGMAASMAGILLQAGDVRWMGKEAWVLIHEITTGAIGKIGEIEDTVKWVKHIQRRVVAIFAKRAAERVIDPTVFTRPMLNVPKEDEDKYDPADLIKYVAEHPGDKVGLITRFIEKHWRRTDWTLSSDECLELGFVDEVR